MRIKLLKSIFPAALIGCNPIDCGDLGITEPGTNEIVSGLMIPSSSIWYIPEIAIAAFSKICCLIKLTVLIAASELHTGPRPYISPAALPQRKAIKGLAPVPLSVSFLINDLVFSSHT